MNWLIKVNGYNKEDISAHGNKYLIGNGYMGIRGTLSEYEKEQLVAVNLAGIYDKAGDGWREPLNAPNGCFAYIRVDGEIYRLPEKEPEAHEMSLDYQYGIFVRKTQWKTRRGTITFSEERFASMEKVHTIVSRFKIGTDFHADIELVSGIDADVWELNGPHYDTMELKEEEGIILTKAVTHEKAYQVAVAETVTSVSPVEIKTAEREKKNLHRVFFITSPGQEYCIEKFVTVYTQIDTDNPAAQAIEAVKEAVGLGYEKLLEEHKEKWKVLWKNSFVQIEGDDIAMEALNYSLYHLHSIAPRHSKSLSIPARGLSGQTYKGAVFWDTEMFMLDFFLFTEPETAKTLIQYRIDTLEGARKKAESYGYQGAFYAWESQEGGFDACTDYNVTDVFTGRPMRTYFKDKQIHISAAIVYGIMRYISITGDDSILFEGGVETVLECAAFYYDLLLKHLNKGVYELHDVIGPDEYHERVNNNGYTNRMAKLTFETAVWVIDKLQKEKIWKEKISELEKVYPLSKLKETYQDAVKNIYIPSPNENKIIPQFDGYFKLEDASLDTVKGRLLHEKEYWGGAYGVASHTQIIKQADVVTWLNLFSREFSEEILKANWEYYEPRTEHGSSLSACMYAMLACKIGRPDDAYPLFLKSASADIKGGGKEWAGLVYIGGTHPAAAGGAYMTAVEGFAGITFEGGKIKANPKLPHHWRRMTFRICYQNKIYEINIENQNSKITEVIN